MLNSAPRLPPKFPTPPGADFRFRPKSFRRCGHGRPGRRAVPPSRPRRPAQFRRLRKHAEQFFGLRPPCAGAALRSRARIIAGNTSGFPDCMIKPRGAQARTGPLGITAEGYNEWTARREDFKGQPLTGCPPSSWWTTRTPGSNASSSMHNGGHAVCVGTSRSHYGHQFVHEASMTAGGRDGRGRLRPNRRSGAAQTRFPAESIRNKEDLYRRGAVPEMRDQILRVVRQPSASWGLRSASGAARPAPAYGVPGP